MIVMIALSSSGLLLPGSPWACSGNVWAFVCTFLVVPLVLLADHSNTSGSGHNNTTILLDSSVT